MRMNRSAAAGFVSGSLLLAVAVTGIISAAATYGFITYQDVIRENQRLAEQLESNQQAATISADTSFETTATSSEPNNGEASKDQDTSGEDTRPSSTTAARPVTQQSAPAHQPLEPQHISPTTQDAATPAPPSTNQTTEDQSAEPIKIEDVNITTATSSVLVTWRTTHESDSMFLLGNNQHLSDNKASTHHQVEVTGLQSNTTYNYEIIAWREGVTLYSGRREVIASWRDPEVVLIDNFVTDELERVFVTRYVETEVTDDEECLVIEIADTLGVPLARTQVTLDGVYDNPNGFRYSASPITRNTSQDGIVRYCRPVTELRITNTATGEVYQEKYPTYQANLQLPW